MAAREAQNLKHAYVGTEHLLLGLLAEKDGIAVRALQVAGLTEKEGLALSPEFFNIAAPVIPARCGWSGDPCKSLGAGGKSVANIFSSLVTERNLRTLMKHIGSNPGFDQMICIALDDQHESG